jgi:hypothetical protein
MSNVNDRPADVNADSAADDSDPRDWPAWTDGYVWELNEGLCDPDDAHSDQGDDADDFIELVIWLDADAPPTADDESWHDGYVSGLSGVLAAPDGLVSPHRDSWLAGYTAGIAARTTATQIAAAEVARQQRDQAGGVLPGHLAQWIAQHRTNGHDA